MHSFKLAGVGLAAALLVSVAALPAVAQPDVSGSTTITEPNGFPPVCNQPCYTVEKAFEVFLSGNPSVPAGPNCPAGENTYIYQLTHQGGAGPFVPGVTAFEQAVETDDVSSAGFIPGFGINPSATTVGANDIVRWDFGSPVLGNGQTSTKLFVCSSLLPGNVTDNMVSTDGQFSIDAPGTCLGPLFEPAGEPLPCTIGFWKNRAAGKQGTLQHFPDPQFDAVVTAAVALSGGVFLTETELLDALQSKGNRTDEERARQQLAAFLLDLAAGQLFPDNTKCKLFDGNVIDSNACGTNLSIGEALQFIFDSLANGEFEAAKDCADDVNNGIGVVGAGQGQ